MKNRYFKSILFVTLLLAVSTCQKETIETDKDPVTVEGEGLKLNVEQTVIDLSSAIVTELESVDTFEYNGVKFPKYELTIEATQDEAEKIQPGTVIYVPWGDKGGKVIFVYETGDPKKSGHQLKSRIGLAIKGFQATLDMYFNYENAVVEFSTPDNRSKTNSAYPYKLTGSEDPLADVGIKFEAEPDEKLSLEFSSSPEALCKLEISAKLWESGDSYISTEGSLTIHPAIDLVMRYEPEKTSTGLYELLEAAMVPDALLFRYRDRNYFLGNMQQLRTSVYTDIDRELSFKIHLTQKYDLATLRIPLGALVIPSYPVSAAFKLSFEVNFNAMGELGLECYENEYYNVVLGVDIDQDLEDPEWYYEFSESSESGLVLKARVELTAGIYLILESEVYVLGVIGPEFAVGGFLEAKAAVGAVAETGDPLAVDWKLTADAGIKAETSLNIALFHIDYLTWKFYTMAEKTWSKNIYLAPQSLKIEQGNNQTGIMGEPLPVPISVGAYDSRGSLIDYLPVPVYFETTNGSVEPSDMVLTSGGFASAVWTLDDENETQQLDVHFKDGEEKKGELTINATAEPPDDDDDDPDNGEIGDTFTDPRDGNLYRIVQIGDQVWMKENLRYLPQVSPSSEGSRADPHYYVYGYEGTSVSEAKATDNYQNYGVLYNWPAAMDGEGSSSANPSGVQGVCPAGWHLPSDSEWTQLTDYVASQGYSNEQDNPNGAGRALKSCRQVDSPLGGDCDTSEHPRWNSHSTHYGIDKFGFSALPGGCRHDEYSFRFVGDYGYWWSSTEFLLSAARTPGMRYDTGYVSLYLILVKEYGFSVRCVRD